MRIGQNPNRQKGAASIGNVILAAVTHLPNEDGYHAQRFEVIKASLETARRNANTKATVVIWDNGSGDRLRDWLRVEYRPDVLIESINAGKAAARTSLFRMFHPNSIVAYADDDMLFYPNWLEPQIELLQTFPNVASVTGYPVRTQFRWGCDNTLKWARANAKLEKGLFIPREWENDFARSIGRDEKWHEEYTKDDTDYRVTLNGKTAYCTSHHCQFIGRADLIGSVLQYDNRAMGDERPFDIALDTIGLRLATTKRLVRHMGNVIDDDLKQEVYRCLNT
jgi:glycosyltransferase involved in cell wall biosynthesis